jgi:hypothetical protein
MEYDHAPVLAFCVLGGRYGTPSPDRDVAAIRGLAVRHPIPPTPRPYGLLPNLSGSSGTPSENLARGSFLWPGPTRKSPAKGGAKVASDTGGFRHWSGRAREIARPVALAHCWSTRAPLPRLQSPTQRAGDSRQAECSSERLTRSRAPLRPKTFSERL